MGKLRGVLIGCGAIAREHLAAVAELGDVEVAGICDISPVRAEAAAERFGIARWYTSHQKLLDDIRPDLVHITTPPSSHFAIARDCLSAGLNVLCEKPITLDYAEFVQLKTMAARSGCMFVENQSYRFHSSVRRIEELVRTGELGDVLEVQVCLSLDLFGAGSSYVDLNAPHFGLALRGGVIGDFLPHIAYLAHMFTGPVSDVRTLWTKHTVDSPLPADEFRGFIRGTRANGYVSFSGNGKPNGFLVRVAGTRMRTEADLFEPPRNTRKRSRRGEPALMTLVDGIAEARDVLRGTLAGFSRKLGGTSSNDGLSEVIARTYRAVERREPQPVDLDDMDAAARLVDCFTREDLKL
ncbi:MAG: Gfo/Idh/MocA family oxidoreductase [Xanthobacteraceae bacterium]